MNVILSSSLAREQGVSYVFILLFGIINLKLSFPVGHYREGTKGNCITAPHLSLYRTLQTTES